MNFQDQCINSKSSNPVIDDGFIWCRLKEGYVECAYAGRWNECNDYKSVRQVRQELRNLTRKLKVDELNHNLINQFGNPECQEFYLRVMIWIRAHNLLPATFFDEYAATLGR